MSYGHLIRTRFLNSGMLWAHKQLLFNLQAGIEDILEVDSTQPHVEEMSP